MRHWLRLKSNEKYWGESTSVSPSTFRASTVCHTIFSFSLPGTLYNMTFETEDVPFAGTDAVVYVQLFGENGQTEKIEFKSDNNLEAPKFKRGRIDKFAVETADVGKVTVAFLLGF